MPRTKRQHLRISAALATELAAAQRRYAIPASEIVARALTAYTRRHYVDLSQFRDGSTYAGSAIRVIIPDHVADLEPATIRAIIRWHLANQAAAHPHAKPPTPTPELRREQAAMRRLRARYHELTQSPCHGIIAVATAKE